MEYLIKFIMKKKNKLKILYTAFKGKTNTSKLLLDLISSPNRLYLLNSYNNSVNMLKEELERNNYDLIISFGQSVLAKDTIQIEILAAEKDKTLKTNYDYNDLKNILEEKYKVTITTTASNYLCNNLYYHGLKYLKENKYPAEMLFIHIPKIKNISNIEELALLINNYFN